MEFRKMVNDNPYFCFSVGDIFFCPWLLSRFFSLLFIFKVWKFYKCSYCSFLAFIPLLFSEFPGSVVWCLTLVGKFLVILFEILLQILPLCMCYTFWVIPQSLDFLCFFFSLLIHSCFQFLKFLLLCSQVHRFFLSHFQSSNHLIKDFFFLSECFWSLAF